MSWQAMGAVQAASSFVEPKKSVGFRILLAIAWYADAQGVAGRPGQPRACPTQRSIAARARVHVNTVARWLPRLEEAGELAIERHGAGRGTHTVYRILLPMEGASPAGGHSTNGEDPARDDAPSGRERAGAQPGLAQRVAQLERRLEAVLSRLEAGRARSTGAQGAQRSHVGPQESPHEKPQSPHEMASGPQEAGTKATPIQRDQVADPSDPDIDPNSDPEGDPGGSTAHNAGVKGASPAAAPPVPPAAHHQAAPAKSAKTAFQARVKALADVCGLDLRIVPHRQACERAARQLKPYSAQAIRDRFGPLPPGSPRPTSWHWYVHDWRGADKGEQPRPRHVVANISRQVQQAPQAQPGPSTPRQSDAAPRAAGAPGRAQIAFQEFMRQEAARNGDNHR